MRDRQPLDPVIYDYRKAFGSWASAVEAAFGRSIIGENPPADPAYLVKVVREFGLWTYGRYTCARKRRPDIVPSLRQIRRIFGTFGNLKHFAERESLKRTIQKYLELRLKLGAWPSARQCDEAGVDISKAVRHFGGKADFHAFLRQMTHLPERQNA
jgi:hypothetical protein